MFGIRQTRLFKQAEVAEFNTLTSSRLAREDSPSDDGRQDSLSAMHPEARRRFEQSLNEDGYSCDKFCSELPYTIWNTCPLCLCGLIPVFVVCFSAVFRLDYAMKVTDVGAQIINNLGMSYTVYYTAGCWPQEDEHSLDPRASLRTPRCSPGDFEIAAGEFDALSGNVLRVRNVTKLHAQRLDAVKVTPDWRYITFVGAISSGPGNIFVVNAQETDAEKAMELLTAQQLEALDVQCHHHSKAVREAASHANGTQQAHLVGLKHLQVIMPKQHRANLLEIPEVPIGSSARYRAAFAFECSDTDRRGTVKNVGGRHDGLLFSKIAVLDFQVHGLNLTGLAPVGVKHWGPSVDSQLQILDTTPVPPIGTTQITITEAVHRFKSHACPRFVPSKEGSELVFVAEDVTRSPKKVELPETGIPRRWLATAQAPGDNLDAMALAKTERRLDGIDDEKHFRQEGACCSSSTAACQACREGITIFDFCAKPANSKVKGCKPEDFVDLPVSAQLLKLGRGSLPFAPVSGCPEFVPSLYVTTTSLVDSVAGNLLTSPEKREQASLAEKDLEDTFVYLSDTESSFVIDVDAQLVAVSLGGSKESESGGISRVRKLYDVNDAKDPSGRVRSRLGGCQPIRAAGRAGHMRLQWIVDTLMRTFQVQLEKQDYTAWLACMTADQKIAIVESEKREHWINMSMPYPVWTGKPSQGAWCSEHSEEGCFEVWSNPNPNV